MPRMLVVDVLSVGEEVVDMYKADRRNGMSFFNNEKLHDDRVAGLVVVTSERVATRLTTPNAHVRAHIVKRMAEAKRAAEQCMLF